MQMILRRAGHVAWIGKREVSTDLWCGVETQLRERASDGRIALKGMRERLCGCET